MGDDADLFRCGIKRARCAIPAIPAVRKRTWPKPLPRKGYGELLKYASTHSAAWTAEEYRVDLRLREARLYQITPISTNLNLSCSVDHEHELSCSRSRTGLTENEYGRLAAI